MKFIHTADWHIGKVVNEISMIENQREFLNDLIEIIKREKVDALVIAGDLYDRSIPPVEAVELLDKYLSKIIFELGIPVLVIAGNHDSNERLSFGSRIMKDQGLHIEGIIKSDIECVTIKDTDFYLVPYFDPAVARTVFDDKEIKSHEDGMKKAIDSINNKKSEDRKSVVIAHGYVTSVSFDKTKSRNEILKELDSSDCESERPLSMGGTEFISGKIFDGFDYVALGHLHEAKRVSTNVETIRYSGSPLKYSISEKNHKNSITLVEINENEVCVEIKPIVPCKNIRVVKGNLDEVTSVDFLEKQKKDDYIHFILTDDGELNEPMRKLKSVYDNPLSLERSYMRTLEEKQVAVTLADMKKTKLELFTDFYENVTSNVISDERLKIINEVIEEVEGNR